MSTQSCQNAPKNQNSQQNESPTSEQHIDSAKDEHVQVNKVNGIADTVSIKLAKLLRKNLKPNEADSVIHFLNQFAYIHTDTDFQHQWEKGRKLFPWLEDRLNKREMDGYKTMEKLKFLEKSFALRSSCEAECTVFILEFGVEDLQKLAAYTKGKSDDDFLSLAKEAEGEFIQYNKGWLNLFARTWDYGGGSLLGDSLHSNFTFLKNSKKFLDTYNSFSGDIKKLREHVINDMKHPIYMYAKERVIAEAKQILNARILLPNEAKEMKKLLISLENPSASIQFNCDDPESNCDWGG